jgi:hypothetical protein
LYVVLTNKKIRHINIIQQTECTLNNEINEKMVILEKITKNIKFGIIMMKKILVTTFDCRLKEECYSFE